MRSLAGSCPRCGVAAEAGGAGEVMGGPVAHTPPPDLVPLLVPWQVPLTGLGQPQHQCAQAAHKIPDLTQEHPICSRISTRRMLGLFGDLCNIWCKAAAAAVIASNNRYCNAALNCLESIRGRGFVPVALPGGS